MAWQLIYTSAPRLLEAGRTGFGTVARHRAVSGILASAIERFSQFARQPGHDPRRVIFSHRLITAGASKYHVLSCIRDSGSDYTGRTNHIAHHLIAEVREVRSLAAEGISPADVLLAMNWRTTWTDGPRFLEPADEVSLRELRAPSGTAWQEITGDAGHARLPEDAAARRGLFLILPPQADGLRLFQDCLHEDLSAAWEVTFTTCLEPGDDIGDFRWMAVSAASPLRPQPESATRAIFDLTRPAELPAPPPARSVKVAPPPVAVLPQIPSPDVMAGLPPVQSPAYHDRPAASMVGSLPPSPPKSKKGLLLAVSLAFAGLLIAAGSFTFWQLHQRKLARVAEEQLHQQVDALWANHRLRLEAAAMWLKAQNDPQLVLAHEKALQDLRKSMAAAGGRIPIATPSRMDPTDEFHDLLQDHAGWRKAYDEASAVDLTKSPSQKPADLLSAVQPLLAAEKRAWEKLSSHFQVPPQHVSPAHTLAGQALAILAKPDEPDGIPAEWGALLKALEAEAKAPKWLGLWERAEKLKKTDPPAMADALLQEVAATASAPGWLADIIKSRKEQILANAAKMAPPPSPATPTSPVPDPVVVKPQSPEDAKGTHPVYLLLQPRHDSPAAALATLPELPVAKDMKIYHSGQMRGFEQLQEWDFNPTQSNAAESIYSHGKMAPKTEQIIFAQKKLSLLPRQGQNHWLIARSQDGQKILFELRVFAEAPTAMIQYNPPPEFQASRLKDEIHLPELGAFLHRIHLSEVQSPQYAIRSAEEGASSKTHRLQQGDDGAWRVSLSPQEPLVSSAEIKSLQNQIDSLQKGIEAERNLKKQVPANDAERDKKTEKFDQNIARKEAEKQEIYDKITALNKGTPSVTADLPSGSYALLEMSGGQQVICTLHIQVKPPAPTPP